MSVKPEPPDVFEWRDGCPPAPPPPAPPGVAAGGGRTLVDSKKSRLSSLQVTERGTKLHTYKHRDKVKSAIER